MVQSIEDGRRKAGDRSIADKIIKRLHDLEKTVENNQGRWAWELLQNAKDSIAEDDDRAVSVQIQLDEDSVEFKHNGTHFTDQDVIGLISQISSKEVEEGQKSKKTGRFGTGFLTTHLLSRVIRIKGILKSADRSFHEFEFLLDRRGKKIAELIPKIENSWSSFRESIKQINLNYDKNQFNTSFCYQLETEEQKRIAQIGVEEFSKLIPFVLAFIPKISNVKIIDNITKNTIIFENKKELREGLIEHISKTQNSEETDILILSVSNNKVSIATEITRSERGYSVQSIKNLPKLFCDFPLIGTENFHFPVIVNSFFFNPQTERDGIWLKGIDDAEVEENQKLLENAAELYGSLISQVAEKNFFDLYNLAETEMPSTDGRYFDEKWYKEFIQEPIRELIYSAKIVELEDEAIEKKAIKGLWFPVKSLTKVIKEEIWQFTFDLSPSAVCKRTHLHNWCDISWEDWKKIDYQVLVSTLAKQENIHKLSQSLKGGEDNTFDWLNRLYDFIIKDESNLALFIKSEIIPNQNEIFKKKSDLYIDEIKDDDLINILELLGEDWKNILLHHAINPENHQVKDKKNIADKITEKLSKSSYQNNSENLVKPISLLCEWFENNETLGKELFSELYRKRAELFMNTIEDKDVLYKVMRTYPNLSKLDKDVQRVEQLESLLNEFGANNMSDLQRMLRLAQDFPDNNSKIQITQETLLSLGITSIEDLEEALTNQDIAAEFTHTSTPTRNMFLSVQRLIARAKKNIIEYLKNRPDYDCSELEELASTVIGGIKKDGLSINIVVRPSDNGEVIVHYSSEKDALDYVNAELWIDNGVDEPKHLTLGKILKTTGINRIPV